MTIAVSKVGHLVLRVSDLSRSLAFTKRSACTKSHAVTSARVRWRSCQQGTRNHDSALVEANVPRGGALHHFALKVGDSRSALSDVRGALDAAGVTVHMALDHRVSQGLYISDPDGNLIELYVDDPQQTWRQEPSLVANSDPSTL